MGKGLGMMGSNYEDHAMGYTRLEDTLAAAPLDLMRLFGSGSNSATRLTSSHLVWWRGRGGVLWGIVGWDVLGWDGWDWGKIVDLLRGLAV